jgi:tetratricopeptide (TPR) repeat protein
MYKLAARTADVADKENQSWCLTQLGDEYWRNGKYTDAEKAYDEALGLLANYPLALAGKGRARAAQNDLPAAVRYLSAAVERSPHTGSIIQLGDMLGSIGNAEGAASLYRIAENGDELLGDVHDAHRVALLWADQGKNLDEALAIAEADYADVKDVYAADILAWCLYKKGRFAEAREKSRKALRINTKDAVLLYHAGMIENALGNRTEARRLLKSAIDLNPAFDLIQADIARKTLSAI